jgi:hypothetical protein
MTGYSKNNVYGIITDYTDPTLTSFLRRLAGEYGGIQWVDTKCKYGCSGTPVTDLFLLKLCNSIEIVLDVKLHFDQEQ